jgi:hypothetical protein
MNNKGQFGNVGGILLAAIGVIVALALLIGSGGISGNVGTMTNTATITNESITLAAAGSAIERTGCVNYAGTPILINATGGEVVTDTNYTFGTGVSSTTGNKVVKITTDTGAVFASRGVNASYTCLPQGYAEDAASRTMIELVILLSVLAVVAFVLYFVMKNVSGMM